MAMTAEVAISAWLSRNTGRSFASSPAAEISGGSVHRCVRWPGESGDAFVKLAAADSLATFEAEAAGLQALAEAAALRVPAVLAVGHAGGHALLALEWLDLVAPVASDRASQALLGERLAMQHRVTARRSGWHRDNTIGATPQLNAWGDDWVRFFRERRLGFQLDLAAVNGLDLNVIERGRDVAERCGAFFFSHRPVPSLLHGDLWGGNWGVLAGSREPAIFDPAVYYGDRETDIAMTRLFGGFGPRFYAAYQSAWPLDQAAGTRRTLYNLYHVLNHFNLFGGGYGRQAAGMIDRLLAELGA
jgi:protein-ribulosamine 3-kinase